VQVGAGVPGGLVQRAAVLGEQRLVRAHHRLAVLHGGQQQRPGGLDAADHLDHDVHVRAGGQGHGIAGEQRRVHRHRAGPARPPDRHPGHLQRGPDPGGQVGGLLAEQPVHLRTHPAAAEQRDPHWLAHL